MTVFPRKYVREKLAKLFTKPDDSREILITTKDFHDKNYFATILCQLRKVQFSFVKKNFTGNSHFQSCKFARDDLNSY